MNSQLINTRDDKKQDQTRENLKDRVTEEILVYY